MTVMTNLVVALMIVTQGEESVRAYPEIEVKRPESQYCVPVGNHVSDSIFNSIVLVRPSDDVETLYRKTCKTNFVYGTTIKTDDTFRLGCRNLTCGQYHVLKPDELYKERIYQIFFDIGKKEWACPKHRYEGEEGGAK